MKTRLHKNEIGIREEKNLFDLQSIFLKMKQFIFINGSYGPTYIRRHIYINEKVEEEKIICKKQQYRFQVQTHCSSANMEPFTLTLVFQFFALEPVCRSHSLSVCFSVPQDPHLQTTLPQKE